jgi:hypothetical protein
MICVSRAPVKFPKVYRSLTVVRQHQVCIYARDESRIMTYVLPRAFFIVLAWAMTGALIRNLWAVADPMIFAVVGAPWVFGGIAYFAYLRKLRRDIEDLERRRYGASPQRALPTFDSPAAD